MRRLKFAPAVTGLRCIHQGKVRDTFEVPGYPDLLLIVATDRVSTHNVVHESIIPNKGHALTALTVFWMKEGLPGIKTHLVASGDAILQYLPSEVHSEDLVCRGLMVQKLMMIPVEFIFRNRMAGSLWKDYYQKGKQNPYNLLLPPDLQLMSPFACTVFTPTDKSETDDPLDAGATAAKYPEAYQLALNAYEAGRVFAAQCGIEIIDGKFEVGVNESLEVVLADECLTPDSCRFVRDEITIGQEPAWLDKQYLREEAERVWGPGSKKTPLFISKEVVDETERRYMTIVKALTGMSLGKFQQAILHH